MEKRVLLAVFLSFLVLYGYQAIFPPPKPARKPAPAAATSTATTGSTTVPTPAPSTSSGAGAPASASSPSASTAAAQASATSAQASPEAPAVAADVSEPAERSIVVRTSSTTATLSNRGAVITSWKLLHYKNSIGGPVDLVPEVPPGVPRPFSLRTDDPAVTARLNGGLYRVTVDGQPVSDEVAVTKPTTIMFAYREPDGVSSTKTFRFEPDGYVLTYGSQVSNGGRTLNPVLEWGPGLGDSLHVLGQKSSFGAYVQHSQAIVLEDGKVHRLDASGIAKAPSRQGTFPFAGIDDHYFIATLVEPGLTRVQYAPKSIPIPGTEQQRELVSWSVLFAQPPNGVRFFVGPKDFDVLASVDRTLVKAIYFGMWDFLAVPLLRALKWIDGFVGNYGWSIIILTILINFAMFPLRHKSVVSMRKMQELQPQIKAIQDRYAKFKATDPERQKMNTELMALYKERGVNPASGCLPMILTMPVLFAFYSLLSVAIEMRGAPFGLWIKDLSVHDPYYITPLIMAATMFWQQKMTPVADPAQARVMMLTPVMFLFFFLWAPSGLVIYWTVSNLLGIAQQKVTNRIVGAPVVKQVRPPAERRLKSAGAGATESARKAQ
jgi:YidC/Oxa1 family membrane protein insertase